MARYRRLESASGPQDHWVVAEGRAATMGQSFSARGCEEVQVGPDVMSRWFEGVELSFSEEPPDFWLPDHPSAPGDHFRAAAESGRSAAWGKIHWYSEGSCPPDLGSARRICSRRKTG